MREQGALTRGSSWRPLLAGAHAEQASAVAAEIAAAVAPRMLAPDAPPGLDRGIAGVALLVAEIERSGIAVNGLPASHELLRAAVARSRERPLSPDLWSGAAGLAFAVTRIRGPGPSAGADRALVAWARRRPQEQFDLIMGVTGAGVQALELLPDPRGAELLAAVVDALAHSAERDGGGLAWRQPLRAGDPRRPLDAGVAHGTPGVAAFLAGAVVSGRAPAGARELLEGALAWTLSQRLRGSVSSLPYDVEAGAPAEPARLAWCYGDAGGALAVIQAADALDDADGRRAGEEMAASAAERDPSLSGVVDAGLCHGAAGLGHLFGRLLALTGDEACARAAPMWLDRTIEMRQDGVEVAGFPAHVPDDDGEWGPEADPGLLGGAAGVGLALLAACRPEDPSWDRVLLASHRFR